MTEPSRRRTSDRRAWRRLTVVALGITGLAVAIYLALDQVGVLTAWEPLFGTGTEAVLHSALSRSLPIPDAAAGAFAYLVEVVTAVAGGDTRWRARPRVLAVYVLTGITLGIAACVLIVIQAWVVRAWCTFCLASAAISIALAVPAMDEGLKAWRSPRNHHRFP